MGLSNFAEEQALRAVLEGTFVGLSTSVPTSTGPGSEVSAPEYVRHPWTPTYTQGDPTEAKNGDIIEFPPATSTWGTVRYAVLFDSLEGGQYLGAMELRNPDSPSQPLYKTVTSGDILRFLPESLVVRLG